MFDFITEALLGKVKSTLLIVSTVIAILSGGYGFFMKVKNDKISAERDNLEDRLTVLTTENVTYENELGQTVTKTIQYQRYIDDLEHSNDSLERKIYTTVSASNLKQRQLKEALVIAQKTIGGGTYQEVRVEPIQMSSGAVDSVVVKHFDDGFLKADIYEDSLSYTYTDSVTVVKAERLEDRNFFLWRWIGWKKKTGRDMVEVTFTNPNTVNKSRFIKLE